MKQRYIKVNRELIPVSEEVYQVANHMKEMNATVPAVTANADNPTIAIAPETAQRAPGSRKAIGCCP